MDADKPKDKEGKEVVKAEETVKGCIADGEATSDPVGDRLSDLGDGRYKAGNDGRTSEAHLPSRKDVTDKGGSHHQ